MSGALSGVIPAHGASSSQHSRSPTTGSVRTHRGDHLLSEQHSLLSPRIVAMVGQPRQELAHQTVLSCVDLDAVAAGSDSGLRR